MQELKRQFPQTGWRLQREDGVICAGYQQLVKVEAESSSRVELRFNDRAMREQSVTRQDIQGAWDAVSSDVSVRWSS